MLNQKTYSCGICKTTPDQISHHKSHIETQKHKDKRELFEFKLSKLTNQELEEKYKTDKIKDIIQEIETIIYTPIYNINSVTYNKKLKQNIINYKSDITEDMNSLKNTAIEQTNSVSNKEALKDKIHEIHNYLRNNGAGYGMNALKVFNILYGLKKIEEHGLLDKVSLKKPDCEFSYILSLANESKDEELAELIFGPVLDSISKSELKELLFYEIPKNIRGSVFVYLIKEINKITLIEKTCNVLLSGKIYEYFIGRDESAISELGAYFTDRHIVDYILSKLNPSINDDGSIETMIDMFGGSGGFTTGYINHLNENYPQLINWTTEINKISHFDMNEDVIKSAGLEFFCLTGVLPNMDNLKYKNSFTDEFNGKKYKYPLTNPPYAGDKKKQTAAQNKREKVKEFIKNELPTITDEGLRIKRQKQLKTIDAQEKQDKKESDKTNVSVSMCSARIQKFAKDHALNGNDKESCSLMLLMDIVDFGGTAIGVLKEGVFFDQKYKHLRKCLVENFNVREVISVPQKVFENTSTKTSIIIFDNTDTKTTEVKFSDLVIERYSEDKFTEISGDIYIVENKGDIIGVSDTLISQASRGELLGNAICSFNGKDYGKKEIVVGDGYELVKLGDICEIRCGKNLTKEKAVKGIYNVYGGGNSSYTHNEYNLEGFNTIISRVGNNSVTLVNENLYLTDNGFSLIANDKKIHKYVGFYILNNKDKILNAGNGSAQKVISKSQLSKIKISIPKSQAKIQEWVDKISAPYNEKNTKQTQIKELEAFVQNRIREIGENEECDEVELGSVCEINNKNIKRYDTSYGLNKGNYKFITGATDGKYYCNEYNIDKYTIIINKTNGSGKCNIFLDKYISCAKQTYIIQSNNNELCTQYIYNYLSNKVNLLEEGYLGACHKNLSCIFLNKFKIKLPKNKTLIQDLEATFQQIETLQNEVKVADELYKQLIQELSQEAIPLHKQNIKAPTIQLVDKLENKNIDKIGTASASSTASSSSKSNIKSLKEQCKSLGIIGYSTKKKADLIKMIEQHTI